MSNKVPDQDEPPEHLRFAVYLQALAQVRNQEAPGLMTEVLADPDPYPAMAQSAVICHLDRWATDLLKSPEYATWAQAMVKVLEPHPFLVQRLQEWSLVRAVALAQPWLPGALTNFIGLAAMQDRRDPGRLRCPRRPGRDRPHQTGPQHRQNHPRPRRQPRLPTLSTGAYLPDPRCNAGLLGDLKDHSGR
ncbi:hypothetical protein [Streptomyces sp. NBC_01435]|uniref:hypothetical protein n=1 Tax=Streptomyces sp. NBC_01435 TaxID=2903865 RepID=UPI002E32452A|nr:hypothetical protein [Streptomyces sp. NBC_01435]